MITMAAFQALGDPFDQLVAELESEFGMSGCTGLAQRYVEAEEADFHWRARRSERVLGTWKSALEEDARLLKRIAVIGVLRSRWYVAACLVDGSGAAEDLLWLRHFERESDARQVFDTAR